MGLKDPNLMFGFGIEFLSYMFSYFFSSLLIYSNQDKIYPKLLENAFLIFSIGHEYSLLVAKQVQDDLMGVFGQECKNEVPIHSR